jgi:hypothetical protein
MRRCVYRKQLDLERKQLDLETLVCPRAGEFSTFSARDAHHLPSLWKSKGDGCV